MDFLDRERETERLDRLLDDRSGALAVVYGRRRIGKTRLLLEWTRRHGGLYTVADQSAPEIQRRYLAEAVAARLPGFADVTYPDWRSLLGRLAVEAARASFRGPITFDELPYLVIASPELPSVLQRWIDHDAHEAGLVVALAGSSQRMMQGLVLDSGAPLYGRAAEILEVGPLAPAHLRPAAGLGTAAEAVEWNAAWGGVPRYWELAVGARGPLRARIDQLVLDPLGPLHREPDRLLLEELPPAAEVRPVLDAIAAGAHRVSEIAARIGRPATSLAHPLERLRSMGVVAREVPFGESARAGKRSLYRIEDPFFRLWFRVVAPYRAALASASREARLALLERHWPALRAEAWEELSRAAVPALGRGSALGRLGPWGPASRWWWKDAPEWDVVAATLDGRRLLLGEAWSTARPPTASALHAAARELVARALPPLASSYPQVDRALFVPADGLPAEAEGVHILGAGQVVIPDGRGDAIGSVHGLPAELSRSKKEHLRSRRYGRRRPG